MLLNEQTVNVLMNSKIGMEYEFYSNYSTEETAEKLARYLNKKISVFDESHSDFKVTPDHYKLEKDYSGGKKLIELVTASIPYQEARISLIKILKWIKENGHTNDRCGLHFNISFNDEKMGTSFLTRLNILKFILQFDEDKIFKDYPDRKNSVYAKSIKFVIPVDKLSFDTAKNVNATDFIFPTEKYYGVNFLKLEKNYLEFRYLGGDGYENKTDKLLATQDMFIESLYSAAVSPAFTSEDKIKLNKILKKHKNVLEAYISFDKFKKNFPDIGLLINLDTDDRNINTFWSKIRDRLFDIITEGTLTSGVINYNSDTGKMQLKGADLSGSFKLENIDIVDCKNVRGILNKCDVFNSNLEGTEIYECNLFDRCTVMNSKLKDCYVNRTSEIVDSYVCGNNGVMNGSMKGGIFREGKITDMAKFEDTEVVKYEKIIPGINAKY
jgi:hypothetical protein